MKEYILGIDPGNEYSGYCFMDITSGFPGNIILHGKLSEKDLKYTIGNVFSKYSGSYIHFGIEMVASYGMAVGQTVFDTCAVIGRLEQYITGLVNMGEINLNYYLVAGNIHRIYRKKTSAEGINSTTMELCKSTRAKDKNVRQAIIDIYPASGGGKTPQIGTKKEPGPLYGVSGDAWSAIAVGLTLQKWLERR